MREPETPGAVMRDVEKISLEPLDTPQPRDDEVLVRVLSAGICRTDLEILDGHLDLLPTPVVLAHEAAGVVEKVGSGVPGLERGDTVILTVASCHSLTGSHPAMSSSRRYSWAARCRCARF